MDAHVASLSNSFWRVPPVAIPAMLDCILSSTGLPPSSLFHSFLNDFPILAKDVIEGNGKLNSEQSNYIGSFVSALCHLLKKSGADPVQLRLFIWKILIPLAKVLHEDRREVLNEAASMFFNVVIDTNSWGVVEATMVPFFLRSIEVTMEKFQSEELAICTWKTYSDSHDFSIQLIDLDFPDTNGVPYFGSFPLQLSCRILTLILDAALQNENVDGSTSKLFPANGCCAEIFAGNLIWDLCHVTVHMLLQSLEHRSCAVGFLLPCIFRAFVAKHAFEISIHGHTYVLSRKTFLSKIWGCLCKLFLLGSSERRDAYAVLSLFLSFLSSTDGCDNSDMVNGDATFDLKSDKGFWDNIKMGLVNKEGLVRKQSLHILKQIINVKENQCHSGVLNTETTGEDSGPLNKTKRGRWAEKEAKSLGVGKLYDSGDFSLNSQKKWGAFFLLYEMLEEYGTHLVEAAWNHQMTMLLRSSLSCDDYVNSSSEGFRQNQMEIPEEVFSWLAILWERGLCHDNPLVRCLIMQSFLEIKWESYGDSAKLVPEVFVLGPFIHGLNDPVHHKDFGVKGVYSSRTIGGASKFICQYTSYLNLRKQIDFLTNLTAFAKKHSLGRAGFMALAECISSAVSGFKVCNDNDLGRRDDAFPDMVEVESAPVSSSHNAKADLLDLLRYIIEISKQHFNHKYRRQVCERILEAATSVMSVLDVPLEILLHFISSLPREFTDSAGSLRVKIQGWLLDCDQGHFISNSCETNVPFLKGLADLPGKFIRPPHSMDALIFCDDEDLEAWEYEAKRWARVFFLVIKDEKHLDPILTFIQNHVIDICKETSHLDWLPVKFLILSLSLVQELKVTLGITADCGIKGSAILLKPSFPKRLGCSTKASFLIEKLSELFLSVLGELVSFAELSCSIFWSKIVKEDTVLPGSIRGKLGGPSRRRLSSSSTSIVLQAIVSSRSVASISSWCAQLGDDVFLDSAVTFLWKLSWKIISIPPCSSETNGEISLAAYEMLAYVLKALVSMFSPLALNLVMEGDESFPSRADGKPLLDSFVQIFIEHINILIEGGNLARTRRAILINWKWICVESLLSIPKVAFENGVHAESCQSFFSDATVRWIFDDLVDGLENAGEDSVLPMLRSIRLIMDLFTSGSTVLPVSSHDGLDAQMMWKLVKSSWILHVSCNKRRVAPIAALLSSVLHHSVFRDEGMHEIDNSPGPLKWFVEKILEKCTKSPRTIRLTALHLTGLWLAYPSTIKYYMNELKLLTMYGSVAFDEDFEAELSDNPEARNEVSMLARSPDSELTEEFINTELYARVSVAVLFYKLADLANMGKSMNGSGNSSVSLESGKMFLLELLDSAVQEKDLSKELYKKFSAIHRRKVRVWQMICILSRFIEQDIVEKVTCCLNVSLYRNNLPSVRQYLETFAIYMYLKFPSSVGEQLVPILRNYDMRTQALSSYVFIAANVILHAAEAIQSQNLHELLPPIIPFLTSHHHTLRCFSQLLVYKVLCKLLPAYNSNSSSPMSLERRCFDNLKSYLADNPDCARLRASMESYLDAFDPEKSITPAGIFTSRVEDVDFECVPTSLMERVIFFLNEAREDLRFSMARDASTVKNESLRIQEVSSNGEESVTQLPEDMLLDFQKKITFSKYANQDSGTTLLLGNNNTPKSLTDLEKEDQLLDQFLQARSVAIEESRASRQQFIIVASLLDRIPNLAGLARTCEVFKATGLTIADKSILHDKQFQLISVTAEKWVPIIEVPVSSLQVFLEKKKKEGFAIMGLEQTANSIPLDQYTFPQKTVMILGREKEGIPVEVIHILDACLEIPQLGVVRSLNVHVSGAIALWEYTRQQRTSLNKLSSS